MWDGIAGCDAHDLLHSVSEPTPVRNRVGNTFGHLDRPVDVRDHLCGTTGSDDAAQSGPVGKVRLRPCDSILQTLIQCAAG